MSIKILNNKFRYLPLLLPKYVFKIAQQYKSTHETNQSTSEIKTKLKSEKSKDSQLIGAFNELRKGSPLPIGVLTMILQDKKSKITDTDLQQYIEQIKILTDISSAHLLKKNVLKRQEPGKVYWGFIPAEWVEFFIPKTGVTGFWTFLFTFSTFLVSKEIYVLEHNFYNGLSMAILCVIVVKKIGPPLAKYLDNEIDEYEAALNRQRIQDMITYVDCIELEKINQWRKEGELMLVDAKRVNVALQLEALFRVRQLEVYRQVKNRLDYLVKADRVFQKYRDKNMCDWILKEVKKSLPEDQKEIFLNLSIYEQINMIHKLKNTV